MNWLKNPQVVLTLWLWPSIMWNCTIQSGEAHLRLDHLTWRRANLLQWEVSLLVFHPTIIISLKEKYNNQQKLSSLIM
jgi:hypothetical protein